LSELKLRPPTSSGAPSASLPSVRFPRFARDKRGKQGKERRAWLGDVHLADERRHLFLRSYYFPSGIILASEFVPRLENGHTVPVVETVEKFARALEVPTYQLFYEDDEAPKPGPKLRPTRAVWGNTGKEARELERFRRLLAKMGERQRGLLLSLAQRLAQQGTNHPSGSKGT